MKVEEDEKELTPDSELQDDLVDEVGQITGVTYHEGEPLQCGTKEKDRDKHRWELDPASADDYLDRTHEHPDEAEPLRHMQHVHREKKV